MVLNGYLDVLEASKYLNTHPETTKRLIRMGKLRAEKAGSKWWIRKEDLETFAAHRNPKTGRIKTLFDQAKGR